MMDFITEPIRDLGFGGFALGVAFLALLVIGIFKGGGKGDNSGGNSSSSSKPSSNGGSTTPPPSTPTAG